MLLFRVDKPDKPRHDEVREARALGEVFGIEELNFIGEVLTSPLIDLLLLDAERE